MTNKQTIEIKESTFNRLNKLSSYYKIYSIEDILNILVVKELRVLSVSTRQKHKESIKRKSNKKQL